MVVLSIFNAATPVGPKSNTFRFTGVPEYNLKVLVKNVVNIFTK